MIPAVCYFVPTAPVRLATANHAFQECKLAGAATVTNGMNELLLVLEARSIGVYVYNKPVEWVSSRVYIIRSLAVQCAPSFSSASVLMYGREKGRQREKDAENLHLW